MSPELQQDLQGAAVLAGLFLGLIATAELWRRFGQPQAEWTRKLIHLGGGLVCLLFPFVVSSLWIILVLALAMTGLFAAGGRFGFLKSLHGVKRRSLGAEYYPLTIFLLLLLTQGRDWLYLAAVLVLAVADAFAALVGSRYGVLRYQVQDSHKTLEGSLVFLIVAFLAIHLPTLLMTDLPRQICVLAALQVAILVMGFEAISLGGTDNLFVPLGVVVILGKLTSKPLPEVIFQNLSLLCICLGIGVLVARLPFFNVGATAAIILYAYGTWSLGSWHWALPVFGGLVVYLLSWLPNVAPRRTRVIRVRTVARALLAPFAIMALANGSLSHAECFAAYLAASAAVLAFSLADPLFRLEAFRRRRREAGIVVLTVLGCAATVVPAWLVQPQAPGWTVAAIAVLVLVASLLVVSFEIVREGAPVAGWTASRFLVSLAVAAAVYGLQHLAVIAPWQPLR